MLNPWKWAFARFYIRTDRKYGKNDLPYFTAACGAGGAILMNLMTLLTVGAWCFGMSIYDLPNGKYYMATFSLCVLAVVYWRFAVQKTANGLIRKLRKQGSAATQRGERRMWAYIVGSLLVWWVFGYLDGRLFL